METQANVESELYMARYRPEQPRLFVTAYVDTGDRASRQTCYNLALATMPRIGEHILVQLKDDMCRNYQVTAIEHWAQEASVGQTELNEGEPSFVDACLILEPRDLHGNKYKDDGKVLITAPVEKGQA